MNDLPTPTDDAPQPPPRGLTLPDLSAFVGGFTVAGAHLMALGRLASEVPIWWIVGPAFVGVATTAAGPLVWLVRARSLARRPLGWPQIGDNLWAILGLPWVLSCLLVPFSNRVAAAERRTLAMDQLVLILGTGLALLVVIGLLWSRWVMVPAEGPPESQTSWSHKAGMVLAVAWPIQLAFALLVAGGVE